MATMPKTILYLSCTKTIDVAQTVACSIVASRLDYCNALLCGAPAARFDRLQRAQNKPESSARAGVAPTPGRCSGHFTGSQ